VPEYKQAFFADSGLSMKDYVSHITCKTLISECANHVGLMSSVGNINQYQYVITGVSSFTVHWPNTHAVIGSNPLEV
jgi:hypothetical protein